MMVLLVMLEILKARSQYWKDMNSLPVLLQAQC